MRVPVAIGMFPYKPSSYWGRPIYEHPHMFLVVDHCFEMIPNWVYGHHWPLLSLWAWRLARRERYTEAETYVANGIGRS